MQNRFGLATVVLVLSLAACNAHGSGSAAVPSGGLTVAAVGDNEDQISQSIRNIRASGATPAYITVKAPQRVYEFSPYTQVLLTDKMLVVRTARIFVFRQSDATVYFNGVLVNFTALPKVTARFIDHIASGHSPGGFEKGNVSKKASNCPDCVAFIGSSPNVRSIAWHWNGLLDPWQQSPTYVAWAPTTATTGGITPLSVIKPQSCLATCSGDPYCPPGFYQDGVNGCQYYYYYPSYPYVAYQPPPGCPHVHGGTVHASHSSFGGYIYGPCPYCDPSFVKGGAVGLTNPSGSSGDFYGTVQIEYTNTGFFYSDCTGGSAGSIGCYSGNVDYSARTEFRYPGTPPGATLMLHAQATPSGGASYTDNFSATFDYPAGFSPSTPCYA